MQLSDNAGAELIQKADLTTISPISGYIRATALLNPFYDSGKTYYRLTLRFPIRIDIESKNKNGIGNLIGFYVSFDSIFAEHLLGQTNPAWREEIEHGFTVFAGSNSDLSLISTIKVKE